MLPNVVRNAFGTRVTMSVSCSGPWKATAQNTSVPRTAAASSGVCTAGSGSGPGGLFNAPNRSERTCPSAPGRPPGWVIAASPIRTSPTAITSVPNCVRGTT
ncbi:Uncharacterised protein [Mycobacteroides abscessus subsp. abscessus]|nr:Uncharacterised protein [Mycobacteroides abscessus subsp. abscessus]